MDASVFAHRIGIVGESLNFLGALVLALDIFLRRREHAMSKRLVLLNAFAIRTSLKSTYYKGKRIDAPDFPTTVLHEHATFVAYCGVALLALGFLSLVAYHVVEINNSTNEHDRPKIFLDKKSRISENRYGGFYYASHYQDCREVPGYGSA